MLHNFALWVSEEILEDRFKMRTHFFTSPKRSNITYGNFEIKKAVTKRSVRLACMY